jgi:cysteine desulfurase/selenocysteine lyase
MHEALYRRPDGVYLNSAAEGLFLRSHVDAIQRYTDCKARGSVGRGELSVIEERSRDLFAELLGVSSADVAFIASTSRGLDIAIKSIDWQPGDVIVLADSEFPSALFSAALLERDGVVVRTVPYRDGAVHESDLVAAIDDRTRLVVVSLVSFKTGQRMDVVRIVEAAHAHGALVFVDAVQAVGAVETGTDGADFVCAATFKWMLGVHGLAGLYVNPNSSELMRAPYVGYRSVTELFPADMRDFDLHTDARRFEEGMPNLLGVSILGSALTLIREIGIREIEAHNRALVERLRSGLRSLDTPMLCPDDSTRRGSIVAFETPHFDEIARYLDGLGTTVWARDGRVRVAPHSYNTEADIDTFLQQFSDFVPGRE